MMTMLLVAGNIVCMAESERDLQQMINILHSPYDAWHLEVNVNKTKVVNFRGPSSMKTDHIFTFGVSTIETVSQYKYLSLVLTEDSDFNATAKMVAQAAGRVLGLLIA